MVAGRILLNYRATFWPYLPFLLLALSTLALTAWTMAFFWHFPDDGLRWGAHRELIAYVNPRGPAAPAGVQTGDRVLAIDGTPAREYPAGVESLTDPAPYYGKSPGDQVVLTLLRDGRPVTVTVTLATLPLRVRLLELELVLLWALVIWGIGLAVWALHPFHHETRLFLLGGQITTALWATSTLAILTRAPWATGLRHVLLWLLAPVALHFYAYFPDPLPAHARRRLLRSVYGVAGPLALVTLLPPPLGVTPESSTPIWTLQRAFTGLLLLVAIALPFRRLRTAPLVVRRRRRFLVACLTVGLSPLLVLSLLPELLGEGPLVNYPWTLPLLVLIPLAYAYALSHGDLGRVDLLLNRSLVYLLLTALLLSLYAALSLALEQLLPAIPWSRSILGAALALGVAALFNVTRAWVQRGVDRLFYGGWYDYRTVVRGASIELSRAPDLARLAARLLSLARTMRFGAAVLLWPTGQQLAPHGSFGYRDREVCRWCLPTEGVLGQYLRDEAQPRWGSQLTPALAAQAGTLTEEERALLAEEQLHLWLPLVSRGRLRGVLVLGKRQGEEVLDGEDRDILATLAGQAALAADNVALVETLRARLAEVERMRDDLAEAQRRQAESREAERLHLARELHDGPMQGLYGAGFHLVAQADLLPPAFVAEAQRILGGVLKTLRTICGELRPPALAPFGLEAAIRSHARAFQEQHPALTLRLDLPSDGRTLPEQQRLVLFRVCQEALRNVARHAEASEVVVRLGWAGEQVILEVRDDGAGFAPPARWIALARRGHLGLMGAAERAEAIGGRLEVDSAPGTGTLVRVVAPCPPERGLPPVKRAAAD